MNNLKTKVDDLDVRKLKTVSVDLKKCSREWSCWKYKIQHTKDKVNNLDKKIPDAATLICINQ